MENCICNFSDFVMSDREIVVKAYFFENGKVAPSNSGFRGIVNEQTVFGSGHSWISYTSKDESIRESIEQEKSFTEYTARKEATETSSKQYFTMTDSRKLYTKKERAEWAEECKKFFTDEGHIVWTLVVSLKNRDILEKYGLKDQTEFSDITMKSMNRIFTRLHLNPENMIWWEDYHTNKNNPHMHITFLEKKQTRNRGKLTPKELDMIKSVFTTELIARKKIMDEFGMSSKEILQQVRTTRRHIVEQSDTFSFHTLESVLNLYSQLPDSGRLQYNAADMAPFRSKLDDIVEQVLKTDGIRELYEQMDVQLMKLESVMKEANGRNITNIRESEKQKLKVQLANSILRSFKDPEVKMPKQQQEWKMEHLVQMAGQIDADQESGDFKEAMKDLMDQRQAGSFSKGIREMYEAEQKGSTAAKRVMRFLRQSLGMNKQEHAQMKRVSSSISRQIRSAMKERIREIENEIDAYLENSDELALKNRKEQALNRYLKQGGES